MKKLVIVLGVIIVILFGVLIFVNPAKSPTVTTPGGASSSGSESMQTGVVQLPQSADGHLRISVPYIGQPVTSPITIIGTVTGGGWFFEATFPIKILDADGTVLGTGQARAQSDWMSAGSVPFGASIVFAKPRSTTGTIVFAKDNPLGAPTNAGELRVPVKFQ